MYDFYGKETNPNGTGMTVVASTAMVAETFCSGSGARFSKVPIINGPGKLSPFMHLSM